MKINVVMIEPKDTIIFKFNMNVGGKKLQEIAENFSKTIGCSVICIDEKVVIENIIKVQDND